MTVSNGMRPVHPGEILREELQELDMSASALAEALCLMPSLITEVLNEQSSITADTALRLARYFDTTPQFWLNLQMSFELRVAEIEAGSQFPRF